MVNRRECPSHPRRLRGQTSPRLQPRTCFSQRLIYHVLQYRSTLSVLFVLPLTAPLRFAQRPSCVFVSIDPNVTQPGPDLLVFVCGLQGE